MFIASFDLSDVGRTVLRKYNRDVANMARTV